MRKFRKKQHYQSTLISLVAKIMHITLCLNPIISANSNSYIPMKKNTLSQKCNPEYESIIKCARKVSIIFAAASSKLLSDSNWQQLLILG